MAPLANRLLEVLTDPVALSVARALAEAEQTQAALVEQLGIPQSAMSRTVKTLRLLGIVESDSARGALRLRTPDEVRGILLAADRLAEAVAARDADEQQGLSARTRRSVVRPAPGDTARLTGAKRVRRD